ncbi:CpsD/CapB family tyrosine-protein kinase [Bacillus benzoevorans]|uniref:non-specific protein-tyrosine kinase n=1 Tax=Bacillus benzoevorans TaxID=1456 RepID=A0A7X0HTZ5_9BACI|nr:CpsD/CapB family tyrosine-protein kinase [Bacillus benzoevorans]MBB6446839.1 capsular exopolysaccharide synthesis family protein [Bacillus benzoevorans]
MFKKKGKTSLLRYLIAEHKPQSPISEQYRTIRTNIDFSSLDQEIRSMVITSSEAGEGKSTTAANLAVVFAQAGKKVLLVDSDLRKPTIHHTFQVDNSYGLSNIILKQRTMAEAIQETKVDGLSVLTCGPVPPNPSEMLASKGMKEFLTEARQHFEMVILDAPPLLAVTDAQILANKCDGTVLVLRSGKTEKEHALKAMALLEAAKGKLLGVVLNKKKEKHKHYDSYYGGNH